LKPLLKITVMAFEMCSRQVSLIPIFAKSERIWEAADHFRSVGPIRDQ
jgi:hypothetical protein